MNRLENAFQQARLLDGLIHPAMHPCSARVVSQRAFGIHEFTASHWVGSDRALICDAHDISLIA
jgi:hypothetical protein